MCWANSDERPALAAKHVTGRRNAYGLFTCLVLGLAELLHGGGTALAARFTLCSIGMRDFDVADQCLAPVHIARAEREMPVAAIRPVGPVKRLTGLRLRELEVREPGRPLEIRYLFGRIATGRQGIPDPSSHTSKYVIVGELTGHSQLKTPRLFRYPAALGGTAYWQWDGNFPCRNLTLEITANIRGRVVERIGLTMLHSDHCGK